MSKNSNQRANMFNPNNPAFKAAADHKSDISNPTSSDFKAAVSNRSGQLTGGHLAGSAEPGGKAVQTKP